MICQDANKIKEINNEIMKEYETISKAEKELEKFDQLRNQFIQESEQNKVLLNEIEECGEIINSLNQTIRKLKNRERDNDLIDTLDLKNKMLIKEKNDLLSQSKQLKLEAIKLKTENKRLESLLLTIEFSTNNLISKWKHIVKNNRHCSNIKNKGSGINLKGSFQNGDENENNYHKVLQHFIFILDIARRRTKYELPFIQLQRIHREITGEEIGEDTVLNFDLETTESKELMKTLSTHCLSKIESIRIGDIELIDSQTLELFLANSIPLSLPKLVFNINSPCLYANKITPYFCSAVSKVTELLTLENLVLYEEDIEELFGSLNCKTLCLSNCDLDLESVPDLSFIYKSNTIVCFNFILVLKYFRKN